ncbi:uncharacterized protein TNCV_2347331 [Trichonephila clavipes]|nr:uncharacterized protein TNCV_2347331 [Trichonephila clavipes]
MIGIEKFFLHSVAVITSIDNMLKGEQSNPADTVDQGSIGFELLMGKPCRGRSGGGQYSTIGIAIIKSERKRHEKIGGSIKCGKTCPAFKTSIREQQQEAIKITVEYQSVHAGHQMEVGKLNLHRDDRRNLAALLKAGVPSTKIIEDIQNKCLPTERLGLLTKKDLHNRDSYNPILVYKPVGSALTNNPLIKKQDFILCIVTEAQLELLEIYGKNIIMMYSTHGTNQYGYLLTTVMVCDDNHEGLPVAICYSNRVCSIILEPFFEEIRNRLTHLQPKVFMSDDDPSFWNA